MSGERRTKESKRDLRYAIAELLKNPLPRRNHFKLRWLFEALGNNSKLCESHNMTKKTFQWAPRMPLRN